MSYDEFYLVVAKDHPKFSGVQKLARKCHLTETPLKSPDETYMLFSGSDLSDDNEAVKKLLYAIENIRFELVTVSNIEVFKCKCTQDAYGCDEEFGHLLNVQVSVQPTLPVGK